MAEPGSGGRTIPRPSAPVLQDPPTVPGMSDMIERVAHRLPGPARPVWELGAGTVRSTIDDRAYGMAAEAAFFAVLSLPALMLAMVGSIGFIATLLGPETRQEIEAVVIGIPATFLAPDTMSALRPYLETILEEGRGGVVSVGFLIAIWGGSRAVNVALETLTIAYDVEDPRPTWRRRLLAYVLTLGGAVVGAVVVPALVVGPALVRWVVPGPLDAAAETAAGLAFWPILVLVLVLVIAGLYDVGVPWNTPFVRDLPGAVLAMLLWVAGAAALRLYADLAIRDDEIYGPLATPLVVLLWFYVTAFAVMLGAELNSEIEKRWPHAQGPIRRGWTEA